MKERNTIAVCLQETWRSGLEFLEYNSYKIISAGPNESVQRGKRGSQGVAIALMVKGPGRQEDTKNIQILVQELLLFAFFSMITKTETLVCF